MLSLSERNASGGSACRVAAVTVDTRYVGALRTPLEAAQPVVRVLALDDAPTEDACVRTHSGTRWRSRGRGAPGTARTALHSRRAGVISAKCSGANLTSMQRTTTCVRAVPAGDRGSVRTTEDDQLAALARQPWTLRVGTHPLTVRPSTARDLAAVARMHSRCSARSLLDRYRSGGRPPAVAALDLALRRPYSIVAVTDAGDVVATGALGHDGVHNSYCVEVGLLVEDRWQRLGIGTELLSHLAGAAQVAGYHELIAYPATAMAPARRLMVEVGRTRLVPDVDLHLHTYLSETSSLGLGSVRQLLAG